MTTLQETGSRPISSSPWVADPASTAPKARTSTRTRAGRFTDRFTSISASSPLSSSYVAVASTSGTSPASLSYVATRGSTRSTEPRAAAAICANGAKVLWRHHYWAEFNGQVAFDHGTTITCEKGEALYHSPARPGAEGGDDRGLAAATLACRPQKPARDCNERSLLRRFGAGVKVLTLITTERYTAYREERTEGAATAALSLDGGVGGVMY